KIETECKQGDEILRAIYQNEQNKTVLVRVYDPPPVNKEDVGKILRSVVLANPSAPKLVAEFAVRYPAKQGAKTDAEMTVLVPRSQLILKQVGGTNVYSIDVTGEVLRDEQLYENYRYRFDFPGDIKDEKVPVIIDRFLRPNEYRSRIKVVDINSGAEVVLENDLKVPEIFETAADRMKKATGATTVKELKEAIESNEARLRIVPMPDELLSGVQRIETIAVGDQIKAVEFYLDGKKIAVKRQPPFELDLDFGTVPQVRRIRAVAIDAKNEPITGDDIVVNTGTDPFRVRIATPRVATKIKGKTRVEVEVRLPEGKQLANVELFWNETRVATMYDPPFVQSVVIPEQEGVGYLRAVASLKNDELPPVEDVVMVNTPQFMEEVNVHLVELPTTVLQNGKPLNGLIETSFKVLDQGNPVKIAKFEHVKNLPLAIGMAVDTSGSMLMRMTETQKAGAEFFKNVMKQGDKAFLVAFNSQPQIVQKWSPSIGDMHAGLAKLRAEDYTALYDAVVYSLYNFLGVKGQKALVILSDGKDTASKFTYDQALEYAKRAAVPIYTIGIGIRAAEIDVRYKINQLSRETGGNAYYIESVLDLPKIYTDIQNELRSQYVLGFYPPEGVKPGGKWREVTVQVSEGKAKTIRGYYP
ncbi:MAG TPA: VWA domain-containing protein, partial [Thermoanaerobaculia bacterium]|nr:VWA domain-containing protein [Thermoanaerobaculia bacterium]